MRVWLIFISLALLILMVACSNANVVSPIPVTATSPESTVTSQVVFIDSTATFPKSAVTSQAVSIERTATFPFPESTATSQAVSTKRVSTENAHDLLLRRLKGRGDYQMEVVGMSSSWTLVVTGDQIIGESVWDCCPETRIDPLKGRIAGDQVIIERDCTGQGFEGECLQIYTGKLTGDSIVGTAKGIGIPSDTPWELYLGEMPPSTEVTPTSGVTSDCTSGWTRLAVGKKARVMGDEDDTPNRVRSEPQKGDNQVEIVYPGNVLDVLDGPVCADGLVFWRVSGVSMAGSGWTAEGDGTEYWLEPYEP